MAWLFARPHHPCRPAGRLFGRPDPACAGGLGQARASSNSELARLLLKTRFSPGRSASFRSRIPSQPKTPARSNRRSRQRWRRLEPATAIEPVAKARRARCTEETSEPLQDDGHTRSKPLGASCQRRRAGATSAISNTSRQSRALSAAGHRPTRITCASRNRARSAGRSATSSPCRFAASTIASSTTEETRKPGGPTKASSQMRSLSNSGPKLAWNNRARNSPGIIAPDGKLCLYVAVEDRHRAQRVELGFEPGERVFPAPAPSQLRLAPG